MKNDHLRMYSYQQNCIFRLYNYETQTSRICNNITDVHVNDLQVDKPEDCAEMCSADKKCVGFVYTTANSYGANCWTKLKMCSKPYELEGFSVYRKSRFIRVPIDLRLWFIFINLEHLWSIWCVSGCRDIKDDCNANMRAGQCTNEETASVMLSSCPYSCGICNIGDCYDTNAKCFNWAERGECEKNS